MRLAEIMTQAQVIPELTATDKETCFDEISTHLCHQVPDLPWSQQQITEALKDRESLGTTAVGAGIAIPHAKIPGLQRLVAGLALSSRGIDFNAIDQARVHLVFVLLVPEHSEGVHLKALARIAKLLRKVEFRQQLLKLTDASSIYQALLKEDETGNNP